MSAAQHGLATASVSLIVLSSHRGSPMVCCSSRHQIYTKVFKEGRGRGGQRAGLMGLSPSVWEEALSQSPQHIPWHHIGQDCVIPPPLVAKSWQTLILSYSLGLVILRPEQNWDFASKEARDSAAGRRCSWSVSTSTSQPQHQGAALSRSMASLENNLSQTPGLFPIPTLSSFFLANVQVKRGGGCDREQTVMF